MEGTRNKLTDLNNLLFESLERLNDDSIQGDNLQAEIDRSKAIIGVSSQIIENANLHLRAASMAHEMGYTVKFPSLLGLSADSKQ